MVKSKNMILLYLSIYLICLLKFSQCQTSCPDLTTLRKAALTATNAYRAKHGVAALTESSTLNDVAQKYSEKLLTSGKLAHSDTNYGENLYYSMGSSVNGNMPIDAWYSEVKDYNFEKGTSNGGATGHFTQLVWKDSKQVGHGFAMSSDCKTIYVTANYDPAGNYMGMYTQNVFKEGTSQTGQTIQTVQTNSTQTQSSSESYWIKIVYGLLAATLLILV
jgi:uncharacterized protein YkwD